jgi:protein-disulfide isomerase
MRCPQCNYEGVAPDASLCPSCGAHLPAPPRGVQAPDRRRSRLPAWAIIGGVFVLAAVALAFAVSRMKGEPSAASSYAPPPPAPSATETANQGQPTPQGGNANRVSANAAATPAPGTETLHARGPADAPVVLEEFSDFECPACGYFFKYAKRLEADRGGRVRFIFRNNPLQIHRFASIAARAAEAAGFQGKFWEMHDALFEHQQEWSKKDVTDPRPLFTGYAQRLGLDVERFNADMNGEAVAARIVEDMRRARSLGVNSTPTVYLNGRLLTGEQTMDEATLRAEVESALKAARR